MDITQVANTILGGAGVCIAYQGLTTWKKQLKGQDEYKLAVEITETVYDLEERLRHARGRLYTYTFDITKDDEKQRKIHFLQHKDRVNEMLEVNNKLRVLKLRADAVWGRSNTAEIDRLLNLIKQFVIDFEIFYDAGWDEVQNRKGNKDAEEMWIVMHGSTNKDRPDKFGDDFSQALSRLEDKMRKKIEKV